MGRSDDGADLLMETSFFVEFFFVVMVKKNHI